MVPTAIQTGYFTIATALAGGSPGQLVAGLRVVDAATRRRPTWRQAVTRSAVWLGPGVLARVVIATSRHPSDRTEARLESRREEQARLAEDLSDHPDVLEDRMAALAVRATAGQWAPPVAAVVLLGAYEVTVGRGAPGRLSRTRVVAIRG